MTDFEGQLIYPEDGVLFESSDGRLTEHWLSDEESRWVVGAPFYFRKVGWGRDAVGQRLHLCFDDLLPEDGVKDGYLFHFTALDLREAYVMAVEDGVRGVCERHIRNPQAYGLEFYDFRRPFFCTPVCADVRECGTAMLREIGDYAGRWSGQLSRMADLMEEGR